LRFFKRVESLPIQAFISKLPVKTFAVSILPGTSGFYVQRPGAHIAKSFP
jgi:hypothetical protein